MSVTFRSERDDLLVLPNGDLQISEVAFTGRDFVGQSEVTINGERFVLVNFYYGPGGDIRREYRRAAPLPTLTPDWQLRPQKNTGASFGLASLRITKLPDLFPPGWDDGEPPVISV